MFYPLNILNHPIYPLFDDYIKGDPLVFDFSSDNPETLTYDPTDFNGFNKKIFDKLNDSPHSWGIGKYLEERKSLLRHYPNIINEKRYYHLGLDIIVPYNTPMYSPLEGIVYRIGKETAIGNYGGYLMLKHDINGVVFYSFYGHLKTPHVVKIGDTITSGQLIAHIGEESDSGGWFCHTHLQIITQDAVNDGYMSWGIFHLIYYIR